MRNRISAEGAGRTIRHVVLGFHGTSSSFERAVRLFIAPERPQFGMRRHRVARRPRLRPYCTLAVAGTRLNNPAMTAITAPVVLAVEKASRTLAGRRVVRDLDLRLSKG